MNSTHTNTHDNHIHRAIETAVFNNSAHDDDRAAALAISECPGTLPEVNTYLQMACRMGAFLPMTLHALKSKGATGRGCYFLDARLETLEFVYTLFPEIDFNTPLPIANWRLLHLCALSPGKRSLDFMQWLLAHGADASLTDSRGRTAFDIALDNTPHTGTCYGISDTSPWVIGVKSLQQACTPQPPVNTSFAALSQTPLDLTAA